MKTIQELLGVIVLLLCVNCCATCSLESKLGVISHQLKERLP